MSARVEDWTRVGTLDEAPPDERPASRSSTRPPSAGLELISTKVAVDLQSVTEATASERIPSSLQALTEAWGADAIFIAMIDESAAVFGTVYFTTHEPKAAASNACVPNLGTSRAYAVKYTNAGVARTSGDLFIEREDAGLAPDLVVGKVTLDNNSTVPFCIGCDGPIKPSQPVPPGHINNPAKIRSYWYIQK